MRAVVTVMILSLAACDMIGTTQETKPSQGVEGIVWFKPGYDASDAWYINHPPDTTPRPLPSATVYLMDKRDENVNSRDILSTAQTDALGRYRITAPPGTYYLAVGSDNVHSVVLAYTPGDTVGLDFPIHDLRELEIKPGEFTEQSFEVGELVPQ